MNKDSEDQRHEGSCLCGKVTFYFLLPHVRFHYCHCRSCSKSSGAGFAANIIVRRENFHWASGEDMIKSFTDIASNPGFRRWFCSHCGGPVPRLSRNDQNMVVQAGLLDTPIELRPERSIYWSEHSDWLVSMDAVPKFEEGLDSPLSTDTFGSL